MAVLGLVVAAGVVSGQVKQEENDGQLASSRFLYVGSSNGRLSQHSPPPVGLGHVTPDSILRGRFDVPLRVAGELVADSEVRLHEEGRVGLEVGYSASPGRGVDGTITMPELWPLARTQAQAGTSKMPKLRLDGGKLDGTPDWLARDTGVPLRVVGERVETWAPLGGAESSHSVQGGQVVRESKPEIAPPEGGVDGLIIEATEHWGVEWAASTLAHVEFCESGGQDWVVGRAGELGRFQFLLSTWATTPYAHLAPQDPEAATFAAAWMVSQGRQLEFTCWPRR